MKDQALRPDRDEEIVGLPAFNGFKSPTSSTTYTPNQFFDVVLPHASRGCLRLVAYLIRKTLGWSDEHGNPQNPNAHVTYRELIECAGISRGAIKEAIEEALEKRFIDCLRFGQPHKAGEEGYSALYSLRWDEREEYITSLSEFTGFYAGNGNLTHIPNQFFDFLVPREPLAVVRVVGVIIRHTIGFQTRFGFRRQHVEMSFSEIMRRTGIASSSTISNALKAAVDGRYIRKVSEGFFDPGAGVASKATTFGVNWEDSPQNEPNSANGSKIEAADRSKNRSGILETVQKSKREDGSESEAEIGPKIEVATVQESKREAFKNRSDIKTTNLNNLPKQQQTAVVVEEGKSLSFLVQRLMAVGIDGAKASELVEHFDAERIERQLDALPSRKVKSSATGFLIRAIERDIPVESKEQQSSAATVFAEHFYAELGGNSGSPVGYTTSADEEAASNLIGKAPSLWREKPAQAGRQLANYVLRQTSNAKFPIRSLPLAVRSYGDEFLAGLTAKAEREAREQAASRKAEHQARFDPAYRQYLRGLAAQLEQAGGEAWDECVTWFERRASRRRSISETFYRRVMQQWETPEERPEIIIEFLSEKDPGSVPSFWEWDAKMNEERFSTEGTNL
ncbi:MAG: hypothetical protein EWV60_23195 [Microcystis sp. Msp_OC_L_20101000_S702]|uniref:hypothetical protein n=1 Tax=Microcystis sp. Msp_OC_L_20101000_S702 TaxID=2486218 RepID=UPI001197B535|nr:hypothetical protein [Microcystis sp. Msp_OC_L_20101000_S702]TRU03006.1 MAG: hypothetical protein EWV60_23195 [Microcystis sp. Msp_OC_L_20101000_S702]